MKTLKQFLEQSIENLEEGYNPKTGSREFQTGERVYKDGKQLGRTEGYYGSNIYEPMYGTVEKHNDKFAHVKWDDGTKTIHTHYGEERGNKQNYTSNYSRSNRIQALSDGQSEQEHVQSVRDYASREDAKRFHKNRHSSLMKSLGEHHHTHFTPEHLDQLEKIHNDILKSKE